ncbi:MAG TPA: 6,7-dimethyl-8-ribityllumazine synthase [Candidatus Eisenbacteria bacterium]|jgi:6,7-dimethyl-8-ribityllumazine synthase|nr:6,7-dimethyl-8-ribityllumazine synthase [Candidatus Eisenbacteria bacterium]
MTQQGRPVPGGSGQDLGPAAGAALRAIRPRFVEGRLDGRGLKVAIACARFNEAVCERLLEGALVELARLGVRTEDIVVARVPGAFELSVAALHLARSGADAVVCLGAVIRGETAHFDFVAGAAAGGIARVAEQTGVPALFGVLTTDTTEQAMERAGGRHGNKGAECAAGAVAMANLVRSIRAARTP